MSLREEWKKPAIFIGVFIVVYFMPIGTGRFDSAILEAFHLARWYAQEHVLLCLIPAFFIAGAIAVFISQASVMKYLGTGANKVLAYGVASVSGSVLAVCSCTVLPLFAGIYKMGAGLGPASAFLYSGPAINVLAIVLTAAVLGPELGLARAVGAVAFSIVIGLLMAFFFRKEEHERASMKAAIPQEDDGRPLWQTGLYFASMVGILVFANWGQSTGGVSAFIYQNKWVFTALFGVALAVIMVRWFGVNVRHMAIAAAAVAALAFAFPGNPTVPFLAGVVALILLLAKGTEEGRDWLEQTWGFTQLIVPLLFAGVLVAGFLLGRPGEAGLIPSSWIAGSVGGNSLAANFFASFVGAFMYFATLTEIPILQGLLGAGMGKGPALALLLAGPALSLPNMLVIYSVLGTKKTAVFVALVITMATLSGWIFGFMMA
ncbi:MAG TPA: permease [Deltaproteobacteria bacterium]|nr:permease [Deltaproteobacteria bacterium]